MSVYEETETRTFKLTEEGERILLANFVARIVTETRIVDGINTETYLTLSGWAANPDSKVRPIQLPEVEIPASQYAGMTWVMGLWGVAAIIQPGQGVKDDLRVCIQQMSKPNKKTIYKSMGWTDVNGAKTYLHAGGAITTKGNDSTVTIRLPQELQNYNLASKESYDESDAFTNSLNLTQIGPKHLLWSLWTGTFAPLFGPVDFAIHVTGRSGTFKSEIISLFQSHYGEKMDARHLPGSWSSTPNALEAQAYYAQNAPFAIDDFVPCGTSWQIRAYQTGADKLIRGQGNQAGRARLTDTSGMQTTYYPRGIILSTGEDTPEGHSVRARMMIHEMSPGDVDIKRLSQAQKHRKALSQATLSIIRTLAGGEYDINLESARIRDENIKVGHTRTPSMIGRLIATGNAVLNIAKAKKWLPPTTIEQLKREMSESIIASGSVQHRFLENADPCEIFMNGLRQALAAGMCHIRTLNGGIPTNPTILGWTQEKSTGAIDSYKSHGPCIGWVDWSEDHLYLDADNTYAMVKKQTGTEMPLTKQTVWKRMKEAGLFLRTDDNRQRNTVRVQADGHQRNAILLSASASLDTGEKKDE